MTAIQQAIRQTERYLEDLDLERDDIGRRLTTLKNHAARTRWSTRLGDLEREREGTLYILQSLRALQHRPELMFDVRPRMAKAALRPLVRRRA